MVLKNIFSIGCRNLLVEGGKNLTNSFLKNNLFNEFYLFKNSNKLGSTGKFNVSTQLHQLAFKYKNNQAQEGNQILIPEQSSTTASKIT